MIKERAKTNFFKFYIYVFCGLTVNIYSIVVAAAGAVAALDDLKIQLSLLFSFVAEPS